MKNTIETIHSAYSQYVGVGMYMMLFLISLLYIYIVEDRKNTRVLLCYYSLIVMAIIFNPFIANRIIEVIEKEVYWRMYWMLPITITIAYTTTVIIFRISEKSKKTIATVLMISILIMAGKFIYTAENYKTSSNWYKLSSQTIQVCSILEEDCDGVIRVVVPSDLESSIRQYDATIQMVYGRNGNVLFTGDSEEAWSNRYWLHYCMQQEVLEINSIWNIMNYFECNYIVLNKSAQLSEKLETYGYQKIASTESFDIYRLDYAGNSDAK